MATLLLAAAGTALGGGGGTFFGALLGAAGGIGGSLVDNALINILNPPKTQGQDLSQINLTGSAEGVAIRKVWGRMRVSGNVIWATTFVQSTEDVPDTGSGKGSLFGAPDQQQYTYSMSFAVALCEGGNVSLERIWADGNELDQSQYSIRFHKGGQSQLPDSLIQSIEGVNATPAYRGIAYLVFDSMNLDAFGSRMPQITAEVVRYPDSYDADDLRSSLRGVALLPGSGEFVYGTDSYTKYDSFGNSVSENQHTTTGFTDLQLALNQLRSAGPNVDTVSLIVTWFGTDLRAGVCQIVPKVETGSKENVPADWQVGSVTRDTAQVVSQIAPSVINPGSPLSGTVPAYGGTPSDDTVSQAIAELKSRGLRVVFYPFVTMDIPAGNGLPDPYGGAEQAPFPWRGRVTCYPAPGRPGTIDKTSTAATAVSNFFAQYNAMITHYANLCAAAGGIDVFIIASELVGITTLRSSPGDGAYPAVQALKSLAATVRGTLPGTKIGYGADWTEYHSHRPNDGTNDVIFNMDPLWSDANIDFVGIDNYLPLSDWRDALPNADSDPVAGPFTPHDKAYLSANVEGGEDFAWYYASAGARAAQTRTTITDAAYGEPWVYRNKDIRSWWSNPHKSRPGGARNAAATGWSAQSKPIWFTELGCPAIDKGSNQPNVFYDPKSSESFFPYFSRGSKDDAIQRAYLEATISYWRDNSPTSSLYGGRMIDTANILVWAWDARPYPDFPALSTVWSDYGNWEYGHWITGRLSYVPLRWIVLELAQAVGVDAEIDTLGLLGASTLVPGYTIDQLSSPRDALSGLMDAFQFDAVESTGKLRFVTKALTRMTAIGSDSFVLDSESDVGFQVTRAQETDLPTSFKLTFVDLYNSYQSGSVEARKNVGNSQTIASASTTAVLDQGQAKSLADGLLQQAWAARETGEVKLPPSLLALDPGDGVLLSVDGVTIGGRIKEVDTSAFRLAKFIGFDPSLATGPVYPPTPKRRPSPPAYGPSIVEFVEMPLLTGTEAKPWAPRIAAYQSPWPGGVAIYRSNGTSYGLNTRVHAPAVMGELASPLYSGPVDRWDLGNTVYVQFYGKAGLVSVSDTAVLAGANAIIVKNPATGDWEVVQFVNAALVATNKYALTRLLRGQLGSEGAMANPVPAGARVVFLDATRFGVLDVSVDQIGIAQTLRYGPANKDQGDATYQQAAVTPKGEGLRPCSVNDIRGARALPAADVTFTWQRRTRFGGDNFDLATVPLNEDVESYDVEILSGTTVVRSVNVGTPSWTYSAAAQATDFGVPQASYKLNIYQRSVLYGRGQVRTVTVSL